MKLINVSNHSSEKWTIEQKKECSDIIDITFPNIPAEATTEDIIANIMPSIAGKIGEAEGIGFTHIMLQGEFSFCYLMRSFLEKEKECNLIFVVPASERGVIELEGGKKITHFNFVQWRKLPTF